MDNTLIGETDSRIWAKKWIEIITVNPNIPTDEDTMVGWFANAIGSGYDQGRTVEREKDIVEKLREIIFQAAGAATRPLLEDHPGYIFPSERVKEAVEQVCESFGIPRED